MGEKGESETHPYKSLMWLDRIRLWSRRFLVGPQICLMLSGCLLPGLRYVRDQRAFSLACSLLGQALSGPSHYKFAILK